MDMWLNYELAKRRIADLHREAELRRLAAAARKPSRQGLLARLAGSRGAALHRAFLSTLIRHRIRTPARHAVSRPECEP